MSEAVEALVQELLDAIQGSELTTADDGGPLVVAGNRGVSIRDDGDEPGTGFIVFTVEREGAGQDLLVTGEPQFGTAESALATAKGWLA